MIINLEEKFSQKKRLAQIYKPHIYRKKNGYFGIENFHPGPEATAAIAFVNKLNGKINATKNSRANASRN